MRSSGDWQRPNTLALRGGAPVVADSDVRRLVEEDDCRSGKKNKRQAEEKNPSPH